MFKEITDYCITIFREKYFLLYHYHLSKLVNKLQCSLCNLYNIVKSDKTNSIQAPYLKL